jgi:sulfopyruvate decarboxylase TPP-binding subunit
MTPSFLEHWAQRDFNGFGVAASVVAAGLDFEGMVIMAVSWLGSTITAHQFFNVIP